MSAKKLGEGATRIILAALMVSVSFPAIAEWIHAMETEDAVWYIDPVTIQKNGHMRKVWQLQDLRRRGPFGEMSRKTLDEYDCKGARYRFLILSAHSEPMAGGKILLSDRNPDGWDNVDPNSVAATKLKFVCSR